MCGTNSIRNPSSKNDSLSETKLFLRRIRAPEAEFLIPEFIPLASVPVIREVAEVPVFSFASDGMLDWAPILFGPSRDFDRVGEEPVHIAAIEAIELLEEIEVFEESSVIDEVILPQHPRDPIERKGRELIHRQENIEDDPGDDHGVDKWSGEDIPEACRNHVAEQIHFLRDLQHFHLLFEYDFFLGDEIPVCLLHGIILIAQLLAEIIDVLHNGFDLISVDHA